MAWSHGWVSVGDGKVVKLVYNVLLSYREQEFIVTGHYRHVSSLSELTCLALRHILSQQTSITLVCQSGNRHMLPTCTEAATPFDFLLVYRSAWTSSFCIISAYNFYKSCTLQHDALLISRVVHSVLPSNCFCTEAGPALTMHRRTHTQQS